jgi:hypothetical protein
MYPKRSTRKFGRLSLLKSLPCFLDGPTPIVGQTSNSVPPRPENVGMPETIRADARITAGLLPDDEHPKPPGFGRVLTCSQYSLKAHKFSTLRIIVGLSFGGFNYCLRV